MQTGTAGNLKFSEFKKLIDEIGLWSIVVLLWGWGEPFLNPAIYDMIAYAKRRGLSLVTSTNGYAFAEAENARKLIQSGPDLLLVSLSGMSQKTYGRYRHGNSLEKALTGIRNLVEEKHRLGSKVPAINLTFIVTQNNEQEVKNLSKKVKSLGVDSLTIKKLNTCTSKAIKGEERRYVPEDDTFKRFQYSADGEDRILVKSNLCKALWQRLTLRWNGKINACEYDFDDVYVMGNLNKKSFRSLWWGAPYRDMRCQFRKDWKKLPVCTGCTYAFEGGYYEGHGCREHLFQEFRITIILTVEKNMLERPQLSVIIASYNSIETLEACLSSLKSQNGRQTFEIIFVDSSTDGSADFVQNKFPDVKLYRCSEKRAPGAARNIGISKAQSELIAFTDTDCVVDKDWIKKILDAHREHPEHPVIGGVVANGNPEYYVGWGTYFAEFSQWMPRKSKCCMNEIPTCCLSLKKWAFDKYGPIQGKKGIARILRFTGNWEMADKNLYFCPPLK